MAENEKTEKTKTETEATDSVATATAVGTESEVETVAATTAATTATAAATTTTTTTTATAATTTATAATTAATEKNKKAPPSVFVTEDDRFEIKVRYHNREENSKNLAVEDVDDEFDPTKQDIEEFTMTFKYPSQRDYALIKGNSSIESINDIFNLELVRIAVLFRKWTYGTNVADLDNVHPSLSKAIAMKVRDVIKYDGVL